VIATERIVTFGAVIGILELPKVAGLFVVVEYDLLIKVR
jgi:hypothetical protein